MSDLLFEIGSEEIPASFILPAAAQMEQMFNDKMGALGLPFDSITQYATPRRLAIIVKGIAEGQKDIEEVLLGPSKQASFDLDGKPTSAAQGFARSKGASVEDLEVVETPKGEYLQLTRKVVGKQTSELLPSLLQEIILALSFPKSMRWGVNQHSFARPIQWIVALFDGKVVQFEHEGIKADNKTCGHRFMAPDPVVIENADGYEKGLEAVSVIGDFELRKEKVLTEIKEAVAAADFGVEAEVAVHEGLLDTVTNLVEIPFGVCGRFDDKFLAVPDEVLITSMREHQKYFPVITKDGKLLPGFVAVNNTQVIKPELTREGHERVLRARLEDAYFFFESDKKRRLEDRVDDLGGVIFQAKLGSMKEKTERVVKLTRLLSEMLAPNLADDACRAALLCKADLTTDMVGEFPSLQGVMGSFYAGNDGENDVVATAILEHYMPLRSGAELPSSAQGALVAMADRLDTIAGSFGIGQSATGTADPFGLRRLSLALLHLIEDRSYSLDLPAVFAKALALYGDRVDGSAETVERIVQFVQGRFLNDCVRQGMEQSAVEAVVSVEFIDVIDCLKKIKAFEGIRHDQSFDLLAGSFKRIRNIIKDHQETVVNSTLLQEETEKTLFSTYEKLDQIGVEKLASADYLGFLTEMMALKEPVDRFFDDVMVMTDDESVKNNRLNLLTGINQLILRVGDISKMHID
ncbi:MAG: glycine--tRNA ligase subunit beta [Desulfofustis sp.]|nr:glycine--tRNA ligase subunit beta [Desulfofustis sp.]